VAVVALETRHAAFAATGAVAAWLALLLLAIQVAYSYDLYWILNRDFEILVVALAGLAVTLLIIFWHSDASHEEKLMIGIGALVSLFVLFGVGGLMVSCANDNCL
jgi:hypothetical protein